MALKLLDYHAILVQRFHSIPLLLSDNIINAFPNNGNGTGPGIFIPIFHVLELCCNRAIKYKITTPQKIAI